ncbi:ferredoxin [Rhodococcus sovatensis]|uniref:Ferredoxin n=1 Tax=Rhodococcus sovatensis TaxID=1805840 RepID=A0ABZ2PEB7_9NOCA
MSYVVTDACVDELDKSCVEECPVDCIYEGARMVYINPDECVDCGKCVPACPNDAIYWEHKLPEDKSVFVDIATVFFDETEASGGAEDFRPIGRDHPTIAEMSTGEN